MRLLLASIFLALHIFLCFSLPLTCLLPVFEGSAFTVLQVLSILVSALVLVFLFGFYLPHYSDRSSFQSGSATKKLTGSSLCLILFPFLHLCLPLLLVLLSH